MSNKRVSYSQFSTWFKCPNKYYNDYILNKRKFEDTLNLSFGTAIHETIQHYLKTLYNEGESQAASIDLNTMFKSEFQQEIDKKKIPHTKAELDEFVEDGRLILSEFILPENRRRYFPRDKFELLGIETEINEAIFNKLNVTSFLDLVLKEKLSGNIRIVDFKTSGRGWTSEKEDFTKLAQLRLYKALYSKKYNIPLSKINVEFFILKRKTYENANYPQTRLNVFVPSSHKADIDETLQEFSKFVNECFNKDGEYLTDKTYPKIPGLKKKNCKYCQYAKDGTCDQKASKIIL